MDDAKTLRVAIGELKNPNDPVTQLEDKLGWTNARILAAAKSAKARGLVRDFVVDLDGGIEIIVDIEL